MAAKVEKPRCGCHGVAMVRNGTQRGKPHWQCRVKNRERVHRWQKARPDMMAFKARRYDLRRLRAQYTEKLHKVEKEITNAQ